MSLSQPRECLNCKADISMCVGQMRYCSRKCYEDKYYGSARRQAKASILEKSCNNCGLLFKPKTRKITNYCSPTCIYDARLKQAKMVLEPRNCEGCSEEFKPTRSFQMFYSPTCRNQVTVLKRATGMAAHEIRALQPQMTIKQKEQKDLNIAHAEALAKEMEEQELPLCTRCAVNKVKDPEAPNMECETCIKITNAEEKVKQPCQHFYDDSNRCVTCGEINVTG